jgi:Delta6-protoilludene synthase
MSLGFMFDKFLDAGDESTALLQVEIIGDALHNPTYPRPSNEWIVGEMARQ